MQVGNANVAREDEAPVEGRTKLARTIVYTLWVLLIVSAGIFIVFDLIAAANTPEGAFHRPSYKFMMIWTSITLFFVMLAGTILLLKYNSYHNVGFTTAALLLVSQLVLVNAVLLRAGGNKAYGRSSFRGAIGIGSIFYIFAIPEVLLMLYYRRELSKRADKWGAGPGADVNHANPAQANAANLQVAAA